MFVKLPLGVFVNSFLLVGADEFLTQGADFK